MMKRKRGKKFRRFGIKPSPRQLIKIFLYSLIGVAYVVWSYVEVKKRGLYHTPYEFCDEMQSYLLPLLFWGGLIVLYIYAVAEEFLYFTVTLLVVLAAWFYFDKPLDKHIFVVNFCDRNCSVRIDGVRYTIEPNRWLERRFSDRKILIDSQIIQQKGMYLINLCYPKKYFKYAQDFDFGHQVDFDLLVGSTISRQKITRLNGNPRALATDVCGYAWKNSITYCIKSVDSNEEGP